MTNDQTLTLEESFEKAQADKNDSTLKEEPTKTEEAPVEVPATEQPKTDEETELEQIDPEKLAPELKSVYKNLMKGFTQGRQKDSERAKAAEEKLAKLEAELATFRQGQPEPQAPNAPQFKNAEEYYAYQAELKVKEALQNEKVNSFREQALAGYEAADERLRRPTEERPNPAYNEFMDVSISGKLDELLAEHVAKNGNELGFDYQGETQKLIKKYEDHLQGLFKSYVEKQNQLVKTKAGELKAHNPKTSPGKAEPAKSMSIGEALEAAREKLNSK